MYPYCVIRTFYTLHVEIETDDGPNTDKICVPVDDKSMHPLRLALLHARCMEDCKPHIGPAAGRQFIVNVPFVSRTPCGSAIYDYKGKLTISD